MFFKDFIEHGIVILHDILYRWSAGGSVVGWQGGWLNLSWLSLRVDPDDQEECDLEVSSSCILSIGCCFRIVSAQVQGLLRMSGGRNFLQF